MFRLYTSKAYGDALIRATMKAAAKSRGPNNNENKLRSYVADNNHKNYEIFSFFNLNTYYKSTWSDQPKFAQTVKANSVDLKHQTKAVLN